MMTDDSAQTDRVMSLVAKVVLRKVTGIHVQAFSVPEEVLTFSPGRRRCRR